MILIIEDDPVWQLKVQMLLDKMGYTNYKLATTIEEATSLTSAQKPILIISDIVLADGIVFEPFSHLFNIVPSIFITSHAEIDYLKTSLTFPRTNFLVKPFNLLSLQAAIESHIQQTNTPKNAESQTIRIRGKHGQILHLSLALVQYIHAEGNYVTLHCEDKKYVFKSSLRKLLVKLNQDFIQVHKAYIINKIFIKRVDMSNAIVYVNTAEIPIGRYYRPLLMAILNEK